MGRNVGLRWAKYGDGVVLATFVVTFIALQADVPFIGDPVGDGVPRAWYLSLILGLFVAFGLQYLYTGVYILRDPERAVANDVRPVSTSLGNKPSTRRLRAKMDYTTESGARRAGETLLYYGLFAVAFCIVGVVVTT